MIDKLIIDDEKIQLTDTDKIPYTHTFSTAKTHIVKYGLSETDEISANAFANCTNMVSIKFPKEITSIKRNAFENFVRLNNVHIPSTIKYIGANAWKGCTGMTTMTFEDSTPPTSYAEIPSKCKVYIPNDSKYEPIAYTDIQPDLEQYYERTEYNMYKEVASRLMHDGGEYYRDKWTGVAPNSQTIEEKNKVEISGLDFVDKNGTLIPSDTQTNVKLGEQFTIYYKILPEDATNRKIYVFNGTDENGKLTKKEDSTVTILEDDKVEGEIICYASRTGAKTNIRIYSESGQMTQLYYNVIN